MTRHSFCILALFAVAAAPAAASWTEAGQAARCEHVQAKLAEVEAKLRRTGRYPKEDLRRERRLWAGKQDEHCRGRSGRPAPASAD